MKQAGIVLDQWKQAIFRRQLDTEDFIYTEQPGPAEGTLLFVVAYDDSELGKLTQTVQKAEMECAVSKPRAH